LDAQLALDAWGRRTVCSPIVYTPLGTVYGGLLSENLNHVWASQAIHVRN